MTDPLTRGLGMAVDFNRAMAKTLTPFAPWHALAAAGYEVAQNYCGPAAVAYAAAEMAAKRALAV